MIQRLKLLSPASMLDIGAGAGTYSDLFTANFPNAYQVGIEVWEPYVSEYGLEAKYDTILVGDVRDFEYLPRADAVILGDVLEHMPVVDALEVWAMAREAAYKAVYLSIPIVHYPQGELEGNPFEAHVKDDWTHDEVLDIFPGIGASWTGSIVGVYECLV